MSFIQSILVSLLMKLVQWSVGFVIDYVERKEREAKEQREIDEKSKKLAKQYEEAKDANERKKAILDAINRNDI